MPGLGFGLGMSILRQLLSGGPSNPSAPPPPAAVLLSDGAWFDGAVWDDTTNWKDGPALLASGAWSDAAVWDDTTTWKDN